MKTNPLKTLESLGQSVWLDYIRRDLIESGGLQRFIDEDALRGMTSNPAIFDKAIEGSDVYYDTIRVLSYEGKSAEEICLALMTEDVGRAADTFEATFHRLQGRDGFVSIEVNPHLARDVQGTLDSARRLWKMLSRPNVLIKVPATMEGLQCIRQLISEGINVNVTLLFGLPRYRMVADAYIAGLEDRAAKGLPIYNVASVASFFVSRIDSMVDPMLDRSDADGARGQIAVSCARIAYQMYKSILEAGGSKNWPASAPGLNAFFGPAPVQKTLCFRTRSTSMPLSDRTRSTLCRARPWRLTAITAIRPCAWKITWKRRTRTSTVLPNWE